MQSAERRSADAETPPGAARDDQPAHSPSPEERGATETGAREEAPRPDDVILAATRAAIPHGLLSRLRIEAAARSGPAAPGRAGALRTGGSRGRPAGVQVGAPRGHARLNVMETLRAAAPWQRLRGRTPAAKSRVLIQPGDFRTTRYLQAIADAHHLCGRRVGLIGAQPFDGGQGSGGASARGLLCATRFGGGDLVPRTARRCAASADPFAGAREAQSGRHARRRRTPLASAIECAALLGGQASGAANPAARAVDGWTRECGARRLRRP